MTEQKKILIILYKYVPEIAPRVFRWRSIVREWTNRNIDVDIVCAAYPGTQLEEVIDNANIFRIIPWFKKGKLKQKKSKRPIIDKVLESSPSESAHPDPEPVINEQKVGMTAEPTRLTEKARKYWRLLVNPKSAETEKIFNLKLLRLIFRAMIRLWRKLTRGLRKAIRSNLWPDYGMPWIPPSYFKARQLIRKNNYEAIITVSWPVSPHVVGSLIHKTIGRNIPWLVDIGDPFSFNQLTQINDFDKFGKKNRNFETQMLQEASIISVTTPETKEDYLKLVPTAEAKIVVIPPTIPTMVETKQKMVTEEDNESKRTKLVFTGSLRSKNRRPDTLLKLFAGLSEIDAFHNQLDLHFYGDIKQCVDSFRPYRSMINKSIFLHGIVEKEIIDSVINNTDFLVNIGNVSKNQLPSKLVEYLSVNHPIINIASHERDSSWNFLSASGIALNILAPTVEDITPELVKRVADYISHPSQPLSEEELIELIKPYTARTISEQYLKIIEDQNSA